MTKKKTKATANGHVDGAHGNGNGNGKAEAPVAASQPPATCVEELSLQVDAQTVALLKLVTQLKGDVTQLRHESGASPPPLAPHTTHAGALTDDGGNMVRRGGARTARLPSLGKLSVAALCGVCMGAALSSVICLRFVRR
jgi:hypothetical protein